MEVLNYSLWFTFFVWAINTIGVMASIRAYVKAHEGLESWEYPEFPMSFIAEFQVYVLAPSPIVLLEYLIMR